jgi:hypothetical protein
MKKTLTFDKPSRLPSFELVIGWSFPFNMVDSSLVGAPEEQNRTSPHHVQVSATLELVAVWGFYFAGGVYEQSENDNYKLMKVLFEHGKRYVVKKLQDTGELAQVEKLELNTSSPEMRDRFDPSRIQDPVGVILEVDAAVNTSQSQMADEKPSGGVSIGNVTGGITNSVIAGGDVTIGKLSSLGTQSSAQTQYPVGISSHEILAKLHQNIATYFGDEELRSLCFDLGVDYADLPARNKDGMARELVAYMEHRSRIPELIEMCRKLRPNVEW